MKRLLSLQRDVPFVWCSSPVIIDKRGDWGDDPNNLQNAPNGAFLKMKDPQTVSHLVQPNKDRSAPMGWVPGSWPGLFDKQPIWVAQEVIPPGTTKFVATQDGGMNYKFDVPSVFCCNDQNGQPNLADAWVQKVSDLQKNYEVPAGLLE